VSGTVFFPLRFQAPKGCQAPFSFRSAFRRQKGVRRCFGSVAKKGCQALFLESARIEKGVRHRFLSAPLSGAKRVSGTVFFPLRFQAPKRCQALFFGKHADVKRVSGTVFSGLAAPGVRHCFLSAPLSGAKMVSGTVFGKHADVKRVSGTVFFPLRFQAPKRCPLEPSDRRSAVGTVFFPLRFQAPKGCQAPFSFRPAFRRQKGVRHRFRVSRLPII